MPERFLLNENDLHNILDGMVDGVITINDKGRIISFNKSAETIFGYSTDEAIGQNVNILMPEPDSSKHDGYLKNHVTTGINHIIGIGRDVTAQRKNGEHFPMRLSVVEFTSKVQGERWFIGSCLDITLYKEQEEQLRRSLKMDAIGKLIGGIAHDYNNMIGVVLGYTEILEGKCQHYPDLLKYVAQIKHAGERSRDLTSSLLSYSSKRSNSNKVFVINDILNENENMLSKILTANVTLDIKIDEELWSVCVDEGGLEDVILNMSINALHAMPEGGKLTIQTSNANLDSIDAQVLNIKPGSYVKLLISDTGIGMTKDVIANIFEPFYTTKKKKGTGLGLSQVYNFVEKSDGTIRVYSELGHGTAFSIYIPRYDKQSKHNEKSVDEGLEATILHQGSGKILIIDDESAIRELSHIILTSHGYDVFEASNTTEALLILENEDIELLISDVIMPDMNGNELAQVVNKKYPNIKIQLCSGFADIRGLSESNDYLYDNLLKKPFTSQELIQKVQTLLANRM